MKLVVMGTSGVMPRSRSRSATRYDLSASDEKRLKSSCWVGLAYEAAIRGGKISAQSL